MAEANLLSELRAAMAEANWVMGCTLEGRLFSRVTTWLGNSALLAHSAVGISPVSSSQKRPSGRGSSPPGAFGNSSWHSGIVATEPDALLSVEHRSLGDQAFH